MWQNGPAPMNLLKVMMARRSVSTRQLRRTRSEVDAKAYGGGMPYGDRRMCSDSVIDGVLRSEMVRVQGNCLDTTSKDVDKCGGGMLFVVKEASALRRTTSKTVV